MGRGGSVANWENSQVTRRSENRAAPSVVQQRLVLRSSFFAAAEHGET